MDSPGMSGKNQSCSFQKPNRDHVRYRTIFEHTGTATILIEEDMTISMVNSELTRISGIKKCDVEGKMKFPELIADPDREKVVANHWLRRENPDLAPRNYPARIKVGDQRVLECVLTVALIPGTSQSVASITDISRQKHLEQEIARISEEERQQMGRVLHDDLGSHLAGVEAMAALLAGRLDRQGHKDADLAREITLLVNQAMKKTRAMVRGLIPMDIEKTGFINAVQNYCMELEQAYGISCSINSRVDFSQFSDTVILTHLYYIIREAMVNAAKHGRPKAIEIGFSQEETNLVVDVRDNGRGGPAKGKRVKGQGLGIMQHRADLMGARLEILKTNTGGMLVRCKIPKKYLS